MTTLAPSEASNKSVGLSDLARVERELRLTATEAKALASNLYAKELSLAANSCWNVGATASTAADTIAAFIASAKAASQPEAATAQNSEAVTTGWRSIETAPNDVSILVAYDDESIELVEAEDNNFKWSGRNPVTQSILGIVNPTHWMPLPEPPKENSDG